mgnify:CR=1 FL=1
MTKLKRKVAPLCKKPEEVKPTTSAKSQKKGGKLPSDEYKDEFEPKELVLDEKRKLVFSVKRGGEFGLPMCDIRLFVTTDEYTGFTKKGINFPIEYLPDVAEVLNTVCDLCTEHDLFDE